jgi:polar amino acid transport system substrate-binding protein
MVNIILVHGDDYPPFSMAGGDGSNLEGLLPRIAEAALANCPGVHLEQMALPWSRAQNLVKTGTANAIITVPTAERLSYLKASTEPVVSPRVLSYSTSNNPSLSELRRVKSLAGFQPFLIGTYSGSGWSRENLQGFNVDYSTSKPAQVFIMLDKSRFDLTFENSIVANYIIQREGLQGRIVALPISKLGRFHSHLLLRQDLPGADKTLKCFDREIKRLRHSPRWASIWRAAGVDPASE